ncbi:hypothetical protein GCM10010324_33740 [Streptomyces hiroshimensis]|uniref:Uncharacterized protein n=1 Tax=Streptomyces hiroshimensis TaxID=66424 RepID=A0ABQ2YI94_9ACTN|nr:hypothetical protein GCM10010324_33740 [Streptomyces hiroshimensis]
MCTALRFVWSYETRASPDTGDSTNPPTASNDTGTPNGPRGTGARAEGSVWKQRTEKRGPRARNPGATPYVRSAVGTDAGDVPYVPGVRAHILDGAHPGRAGRRHKGKTHSTCRTDAVTRLTPSRCPPAPPAAVR